MGAPLGELGDRFGEVDESLHPPTSESLTLTPDGRPAVSPFTPTSKRGDPLGPGVASLGAPRATLEPLPIIPVPDPSP